MAQTIPRIENGTNRDLDMQTLYLEHIIFISGALISVLIGFFIGWNIGSSVGGAFFGAIVWTSTYSTLGFRVVPEKDTWVIERLGKFYRVQRAGPFVGCFLFGIDKVKRVVPLYKQQINLWSDPSDTNNMIDFKDGSCPVRAQVWYKPRAENADGINIIDQSIYTITYSYSSLPLWIEEHLDALLRSPLQALTIEEAGLQKGAIAETATTTFKKSLGDESGIELEEPDGVLITDIVLSDSQKKEREKKLAGSKDAEMATLRAKGYIDPVTLIMAAAAEKGSPITFDQAMELFNQQRAFEVLAGTGSNISFVAPDLKGVMKTMDVTSKNKPADSQQNGGNLRRRQGANK